MAGRFARCLRRICAGLGLALGLAVAAGAAGEGASESPAGIKIVVDRPGVYAVGLDALPVPSVREGEGPAPGLRLRHGDRQLPYWIESGEGGTLSPPRLLFVAETGLFHPTDLPDGRPVAVLRLTRDGDADAPAASEGGDGQGPSTGQIHPDSDPDAPSDLEVASVQRLLRFEEDVLRVAATPAELDDLDTLWFWTHLTQQPSSRLEIDLGARADRPGPGGTGTDGNADAGLQVRVRLLGWSRTPTPEGVPQHQVDLSWNGEKIGESLFDGRRSVILEVRDLPAELLGPGPNRLRIDVPERVVEVHSQPQTLVDVVTVDRVEVRYRPASPLADGGAPLLLGASGTARRLPDPLSPGRSRALAAEGWAAERGAAGEWLLPPGGDTELWIVDEAGIRPPLAIEALRSAPGALPPETDYLVLVPSRFRPGAERLAAIHRSLGRHPAVVDVEAVFDGFGGGERSAGAIRRYLDHQLRRTPGLRWVLLVGDADFFEPDDRLPLSAADPADRNLLPTGTHVSRYGPAASDHFFAADETDPSRPRFAVGRIPVADAATLDAYVTKLAAWIVSGGGKEPPSVLLLRDSSLGSTLQLERQRQRLSDLPVELLAIEDFLEPATAEGEPDLRSAAITALDQRPFILYFGGHGSRYSWQLGDPGRPAPETFFDRTDVQRLAPAARQPIALSLSCATVPFDHPQAGSLGEAMVLNGERGAIAFLGASAPLYSPPAFGEALVRNLLALDTLGEAVVAAKARVGRTEVSFLYSLLGDPGLPLACGRPGPQRPDRCRSGELAPAHGPETEAGQQQDQ